MNYLINGFAYEIAFWILNLLLQAVSYGSTGLFPVGILAIEQLMNLVIYVIATLAGAWIYKEQE